MAERKIKGDAMQEALQRMELLIQKEGLETLKEATVMVVGVGGVGSYAGEALARAGIGTLILVDGDTIAPSNLNRQIHAVYDTIGKDKCEVMKQRIHSYREDCQVITHSLFYDASKNDVLFDRKIDFVIDAIDTITSKVDLIQYCYSHKIKFISSMGMANRFDPTQIEITDLSKTSYDPLAKVMRNLIKKKGLKGSIPVVFSKEQPFVQRMVINEEGTTRKEKMPPASTPFVPSCAGFAAASYVVRKLLQKS